jgi:hypothetical protein
MLPLCAQGWAMTAPSGPLGAQTDPPSSPTRPKMAPNKPQHEPPSLSHRLPGASNFILFATVFGHVRAWLLLSMFMVLLCAQQRAMTAPSATLDAQTDSQSNPTRTEMAPNNLKMSPQAFNFIDFSLHRIRVYVCNRTYPTSKPTKPPILQSGSTGVSMR